MIDQAGILMAQGEKTACERISGINDNMSKSHYHDYFELYYLETGERYHMIHNQLYCLYPGEFILFSPYVMHHSYGEEDIPFKRIVVYFQRELIHSQRLLEALELATGIYRPEPRMKGEIGKIIRTLLEEQEHPSQFSEEHKETLLNLIILTILQQKKTPPRPDTQNRIGSIIQYIHNHYQEDLNLDRLAQQFYISPFYLCREFKRHTNRTFIQYVNITRIMNAQRKFMETDKNVTDVSKETGFSNITHFNRIFKSVAGITPSEYRKQCRNEAKK